MGAKKSAINWPNLLHQNSSFVFFRELPADVPGPLGSLGVPLTAGRSLAVDPRAVPQGAPVFLATTWPNTEKQLYRLMVAQDTGGAIKGNVRADFFWGFGPRPRTGRQDETARQDVGIDASGLCIAGRSYRRPPGRKRAVLTVTRIDRDVATLILRDARIQFLFYGYRPGSFLVLPSHRQKSALGYRLSHSFWPA